MVGVARAGCKRANQLASSALPGPSVVGTMDISSLQEVCAFGLRGPQQTRGGTRGVRSCGCVRAAQSSRLVAEQNAWSAAAAVVRPRGPLPLSYTLPLRIYNPLYRRSPNQRASIDGRGSDAAGKGRFDP